MEEFNVPELDMTGIRAAYVDLCKAHKDLNKARKLRNRGIAMIAFGVTGICVGIYMLNRN